MGLQLWIVVCVGLVAATLSPSIRRAIPRWFEVAVWVALIFVCWLGIASIRDPHARELTSAVNWAVGQIFNTLLGLAGTTVLGVMSTNRFAIANAVVTLFGADLLALVLLATHREGRHWRPQVRLREWMVVPTTAPAPLAAPVAQAYAVDKLSEKWAAATAVAGAAAANWSVQFLIWARDVGLPRTEERLALAIAGGRVADSQQRMAPATGNAPAQVVDIETLRIAQSSGRMGLDAAPEMKDEDGSEHTDKLAS